VRLVHDHGPPRDRVESLGLALAPSRFAGRERVAVLASFECDGPVPREPREVRERLIVQDEHVSDVLLEVADGELSVRRAGLR
jgi:hypothetical protein